jgi:DNA-directed RNA polymerase sigma subunit (sigma70/sigma32)
LLGDVEEAVANLRAVEERHKAERGEAVERLRAAIRAAHDEGIPLARVARSVGVSRERVRQLYVGD